MRGASPSLTTKGEIMKKSETVKNSYFARILDAQEMFEELERIFHDYPNIEYLFETHKEDARRRLLPKQTRWDDENDANQMELRSQINHFKYKGYSPVTDEVCEVVNIYEWGMDCDGASGDSITAGPARYEDVKKFILDFYDGAEGPCSHKMVSMEEGEKFQATFRDHAMEAYEDGHPSTIYY